MADEFTQTESSNKTGTEDADDGLGNFVSQCFEDSKGRRNLYELQWLQDLRQYRGVYEPEFMEDMDKNRSQAFVRLTRTKVKAMDSRLMDMMFPAGGDKNWAIDPVPVSPSAEALVNRVAKAVTKNMFQAAAAQKAAEAQPQAQGASMTAPGGAPAVAPAAQPPAATTAPPGGAPPQQPTMPGAQAAAAKPDPLTDAAALDEVVNGVADDAMNKLLQDAKDRCHRMGDVMDSQLEVAKYDQRCKAVIHSGNLYGTGILMGPLVETRTKGSWGAKNGLFQFSAQQTTNPYFESVRIWDIYPDMNAMEAEDCEYIIRRRIMRKAQLRKLAKRPDFKGDIINAYVDEQREGDCPTYFWEAGMREINGKTTSTNTKNRYEVIEFWGSVDGQDLADNGVEIPEEMLTQEFEANVWVLGKQVIKAVLNPSDASLRPFHFYYFEKDETSVFGTGIAEIMRDTQSVFNAAVRAAIDNAAMSAGPMFDVNETRLQPGEDSDSIIPFRVFHSKGDGTAPAVRVIEVPSNAGPLLELAQMFKQFGDEATTIPAYTQGEPATGMAKTVGGLSMLMGAANITIKDSVRNFDNGVTEPAILALYYWNMQFNPDETIKGNYEVSAVGATSLVAKELRAQQLETLAAQTLNPTDSLLINRRKLMEVRLRALDLNHEGIMYTEQEAQANLQNMMTQRANDPQMLQFNLDMAEFRLKQYMDQMTLQLKAREVSVKEAEEKLKEQMAAFEAKLALIDSASRKVLDDFRVTV